METGPLSEWEVFRLACIDVDNIADDEIVILAKSLVLTSSEQVEEFCGILIRHRPNVYKKLSDSISKKATVDESSVEEKWEQRISFVYGNIKMHNPDITIDLVREIAEALRKEGENS